MLSMGLREEDSRRSRSAEPFGLPSAMRHVDELMSIRSGRMELRIEDSGRGLLIIDGSPTS
jgi:hypothetical protein